MAENILTSTEQNDIPVTLISRNPNYYTFLKLLTRTPKSPFHNKEEAELFPIKLKINSCGCELIIESQNDFPNKNVSCEHDKLFIKFVKV